MQMCVHVHVGPRLHFPSEWGVFLGSQLKNLISQENEAAGAYDDWCKTVLRKMKEASPLSLKVTLRSVG